MSLWVRLIFAIIQRRSLLLVVLLLVTYHLHDHCALTSTYWYDAFAIFLS